MEFWSAEVKSGEVAKIVPGDGMVVHLSQASLGEMKKEKGNESVCLFVNVNGKKLVLGTLFSDKLPQQQFDLVFDQNFEISHNWKNGSVYFIGYKASNPFEDEGFPEGESDESESEEEDIPNTLAVNGKPVSKPKPEKPTEAKAVAAKGKNSNTGKQKVQIVEPPKDVKREDDDSDDDDMMSDDDDEGDSEDDDDEDDSDESDEETPKKVEPSKKRPAESKTPVSDKKAKVTPQKTDDKKGGVHVATPYPKQASKTPTNKPNQHTPKGAGSSHSCKTCNRSFGSDKALESHSKAKHG